MNKLVLGVILLLGTSAFAGMSSAYTSVEVTDCVTLEGSDLYENPEIDFYTGECPSLGGYQVYVSGGDIRYSLELSYAGVQIPLVRLGAFHDMGSSKIEWRYNRTIKKFNSTVEYRSLIYRLNFDNYNEETHEQFSSDLLVVVRLNREKSCVIGKVDQQEGMNEKARAIADDVNATCIEL